MTSERIQRRIDALLDEADAAMSRLDWETVRDRGRAVLAADPRNADGLAYVEMAERGLAAVAETRAGTQPAPRESATAQNAQPTSFASGRYEVRRFLGEGGKKKVYLAHDAQLDRDVAFALIKTEGLDEAARTRVTREAQAMGRLGSHPHIVTVYDIGEEAGAPYLVLPVLPLGDVEGVIEKAPEHKLPIEQAVKIATETCLGLEFSHAKGIIHRDLKPGNVWLAEDGRAMIGDFGLAVAVDRSRLTQAGMMVGTVSYMPPEQAMGGEVTPRSDLYSLGAMLYEMVCGRPPFVGDESVAIIGQHLNTPPVAPSWHRPDCPPGLEVLILRLLEKDPSKRPASAAEVREALSAVSTSPLPPGEGGRRPGEGDTPVTSIDPLYRRTFVGRENETRQLHQAYDAAVSGQGGLVMVVGEPGIGKTALCEQLATYVQLRGGRTLVGHCYEEGSLSLPYLAFVEAMRSYVLARDPDGLRSDLGSGAAEVARIVSEVRDRVHVELRDASDSEDDRWRLLNAVSSFLRNAASVQPLVIVLEDLHWADRGTLDLLLHVARNLEGARLLLVGTYRDVEVDRQHPLSATLAELRRVQSFLRVPLRGLTVDEVHRMYEAIRGQSVAWAQAELVHRQTEGNPLFVQEVLRYLVEEGIVYRESGRYQARAEDAGSEAVIPQGLRDVVGRRLNRLSERANQVLAVASVIGREFRLDVLQRVANVTGEEVILVLEEAQERAIIEDRPAAGSLNFRFTHAFFRETLYEEIFAARRIRWHQQVGQALEQVHSRRLEEHAAELAEHFSHSVEAGDLEKAVAYGELAARRAVSVFDYGEAVRRLEQALKAQDVLDPDDVVKNCDILLGLGEALLSLGDRDRLQQEVAPAALSLAERLDDAERAWGACRLAIEANSGVQTPELTKWQVIAERYAGFSPRARIRLMRSKAGAAIQQLRLKEASNLLREGLELARSIDDVESQFGMATFAMTGGLWSAAEERDMVEEFGTRSRTGVSVLGLSFALSSLVGAYLRIGDLGRAEQIQKELSSLAERTRHQRAQMTAVSSEGILRGFAGDLDAWATAAAAWSGGTAGAASPPRAALHMGDTELAREYLAVSALRWSDLPWARVVRAFSQAAIGERDSAAQILQGLLEELPPGFEDDTPQPALCLLLELAIMLGERDLVRRFYEGLKRSKAGGSYVGWSFVIRERLMADAAAVLGLVSEARVLYEDGMKLSEAIKFRPELALSRLGLAELLLDHYPHERGAAIDHLDFAIAELRDMKMQPALERALGRRGLLKA